MHDAPHTWVHWRLQDVAGTGKETRVVCGVACPIAVSCRLWMGIKKIDLIWNDLNKTEGGEAVCKRQRYVL